jgi:nucleotide-binding universal stress UspA family protein
VETIVVGVDGSQCSLEAFRWAIDEARRRHWEVKAVLAWDHPYSVPVSGQFSDAEWLKGQADEQLRNWLQDDLGADPDVKVCHEVQQGPPARVLLEAARDAALLVLGSRGRGGFASLLLGSVSQQCAQHAPCPVMIMRHDRASEGQAQTERVTPRIVVGVDGSGVARQALQWALEEARLRHATVDVVHAWRMPYPDSYPVRTVSVPPAVEVEQEARRILDAAVANAPGTGSVRVEPILACDSPARALIDTAKGADMVVVGSRGRGGFAGLLLGSVSQRVLHHASCPVVVIPSTSD